MRPMTLKPLGPEGIERRIQEIKSRISFLSGSAGFSQALSNAGLQPMPIQGSISGGPGSSPMNPFGPGLNVNPLSDKYRPMAQRIAGEEGVDPQIFDALIQTESSYDPNARSKAGALGLAQLMPETAASLGVQDPMDPEQSLRGGARYLASLMNKFHDPKLALAAYNAGPEAVVRHGGVPPYAETRSYVDKIMSLANGVRTP